MLHTNDPTGGADGAARRVDGGPGIAATGPDREPSGALDRCIGIAAEQFADSYWGRAPLLTRSVGAASSASGFDDLLSPAAVDELVSRRGLRTPFLRMAKDGTVLPGARFTRSGGAGAGIADQAADDGVLAQLADGATLVLQALHRTWPPLVDFGSRLAAEIGHPVQINAYITPPQNQGFAPHYDVHDVFVLQVAGRKRWQIHPPVVPDPLEDQGWERSRGEVAARADGEPLIDCVLEPGDALYLPRGMVHSAQAQGATSIHLTVGVHPLTRHHLVRALLDLSPQVDQLRGSLPMSVDLTDPAVLAPHLRATVEALRDWLDTVSPEQIARTLGKRLVAQTRPEAISPLAQLDAAAALTPGTRLRVRGALRARTNEDAQYVSIALIDRTVSLPVAAAEAVEAIMTGQVLTPAELPGLDADEQLIIARRLLREAVLVPVVDR